MNPVVPTNRAEILLWAAFPGADAVQVQHVGQNVGLGIEFEGRKHGISYNPEKDDIHAVIAQLQQRIAPN